jgi:hypothetical protein
MLLIRSSNCLRAAGRIPSRSRNSSDQVLSWSECASHPLPKTTFWEADPAHGRQVVRAEPMSTLDAELNDFGAQLAMLGGHAADRYG